MNSMHRVRQETRQKLSWALKMSSIHQEKGKWHLRRGNRKYKCKGVCIILGTGTWKPVIVGWGKMAGNEAGKTEWRAMRLRTALRANLNNLDNVLGAGNS